MKHFSAALLAASVSAVTKYSATGLTDTAISSSKPTVDVNLDYTNKLTQRVFQQVVGTAIATADDYIAGLVCTTREANKFVCSFCQVKLVDSSNYKAVWGSYSATIMPTISAATVELSSATNIGTIDGGSLTTLANTAWGAPTTTLNENSANWTLERIQGTSKTTLDCQATYTDPTTGSATREATVKTGMATAK